MYGYVRMELIIPCAERASQVYTVCFYYLVSYAKQRFQHFVLLDHGAYLKIQDGCCDK